MKKIKIFFKSEKGENLLICFGIILSLFILALYLNIFSVNNINLNYHGLSWLFFSLSNISLLIGLYFLFPKIGKIIYIIFTSISNIYLLAQVLHFKILDRFFTFTDILMADQAAGYTGYVLKQITFPLIATIICSLIIMILTSLLMKKRRKKLNKKILFGLIIIAIFSGFRLSGILSLGKPVSDNSWNSWMNPRNIYDKYENSSRNLYVSGMYEYMFRDIYVYLRTLMENNKTTDIDEINNYINSLNYEQTDNEYSNIFKGKNLIVIMTESIDNWLVDKDNMPTYYNLEKTGLNFINRYSPAFGGGMTINSEFSSITGIYATIDSKPIFRYTNNNFDYSLPNMFKKNGYIANSVHMNNGTFYNRSNFHPALGFTKHYALADLNSNIDYRYDSYLANDNYSYNHIVNKDKFMTFITTYSPHMPYINNDMCKSNNETNCIKELANETDKFLSSLINRLDNDGYLNNTVIVLFTDHYVYGYSKVNEVKNEDNVNLIQNTPFVIWSKDIEHKDIDTIVGTSDILPTLLNMFGIKYDPRIYLGTDIFSDYHSNYVYFNDYTWYDGNIYYDGTNQKNSSYIKTISSEVNKKININKKIILGDYYSYYKASE